MPDLYTKGRAKKETQHQAPAVNNDYGTPSGEILNRHCTNLLFQMLMKGQIPHVVKFTRLLNRCSTDAPNRCKHNSLGARIGGLTTVLVHRFGAPVTLTTRGFAVPEIKR